MINTKQISCWLTLSAILINLNCIIIDAKYSERKNYHLI